MRTITGLHLLALKKAKIYLYGVQKQFSVPLSSSCYISTIQFNKYEYMKICCKYFSCTLHKKVSICTVFFSWGKQMSGTRYLTVAINVLSVCENFVYSSYTVSHFLFVLSLTSVYLWIQNLNLDVLSGSMTCCYYQWRVLLAEVGTFR